MNETSCITPNLAREFGLRAGNPLDEKLAKALCNPASKCTERFVYSRGNCTLSVGGIYLDTVGAAGEGRRYLQDKADNLPELPHLRAWAEKL